MVSYAEEVAKKRQAKRIAQRKWRQRNIENRESRLGSSMTVHMNAIEIAMLDKIAMEDYANRPNGRDDGADLTPPSRSRAIRLLIRRYMSVFNVDPATLGPIMDMKEELGDFWMRETGWRKTARENRREFNDDGSWRHEQPVPPWKEAGIEVGRPRTTARPQPQPYMDDD